MRSEEVKLNSEKCAGKVNEIKRGNISTHNGITLIALVITVIVMLILAGVTINLTLGENGIFTTAQKAAQNYTDAQNKEMADIQNFTQTVDKTIQDVTENWDTLASKAKPGDYVEYDGGNGYKGLWQVLYNDSTYGLQIISAQSVKGFTLGCSTEEETKASYNSAVDTLNTECRKYVNTSYAISGRCVGSNPLSPDDEITETFTLTFPYKDSYESECKVTDSNYEIDYNAMKAATNQNDVGIHGIDQIYWLASRIVYFSSELAQFSVNYVDTDGRVLGNTLWFVYSNGNSKPYTTKLGLRPVVTLASDIQTNDGDGSLDNPFKLVAKKN